MATLTADDIIATLSHSALPTLLIEGRSDVIVLRHIEDLEEELRISALAAGGRDVVLEVYRRRAEIGEAPKTLFFVDSDLWIFDQVPLEYRSDELLTTAGYSIENDMFMDGEIDKLFTAAERGRFLAELSRFVDWIADEISGALRGEPHRCASHPDQILRHNTRPVIDHALRDFVMQNYGQVLRGHSLFSLITRQLSAKKRRSKFSHNNLLDIGATANGPNLHRIRLWLRNHLN